MTFAEPDAGTTGRWILFGHVWQGVICWERVGVGGVCCWINRVIEIEIFFVDKSHEQIKPDGEPGCQEGESDGCSNGIAVYGQSVCEGGPEGEALDAVDNWQSPMYDALYRLHQSKVVGGGAGEDDAHERRNAHAVVTLMDVVMAILFVPAQLPWQQPPP